MVATGPTPGQSLPHPRFRLLRRCGKTGLTATLARLRGRAAAGASRAAVPPAAASGSNPSFSRVSRLRAMLRCLFSSYSLIGLGAVDAIFAPAMGGTVCKLLQERPRRRRWELRLPVGRLLALPAVVLGHGGYRNAPVCQQCWHRQSYYYSVTIIHERSPSSCCNFKLKRLFAVHAVRAACRRACQPSRHFDSMHGAGRAAFAHCAARSLSHRDVAHSSESSDEAAPPLRSADGWPCPGHSLGVLEYHARSTRVPGRVGQVRDGARVYPIYGPRVGVAF